MKIIKKISILFAVISPIFLSNCTGADSSSRVMDDAILRLEHLESFYGSIPDLMGPAGDFARRSFQERVNADLAALQPIVRKSFSTEDMLNHARHELSQVDKGDIDLSSFLSAVDSFLQTAEAITAESLSNPEKVAEAAQEAYAKRTDKERIEALAGAFAVTEMQIEGALVGTRLQEAISIRYARMPGNLTSALKLSNEKQIQEYAQEFAKATRSEGDKIYTPFRSEIMKNDSIGLIMGILIRLPEPALKALEDFYASDVGKAKRKALLTAVSNQVDRDTEQMMIEYLRQLR